MVYESQTRHFCHQKLFLLLIILLKFQVEDQPEKYRAHFEEDLEFCPSCFLDQASECYEFFETIQHSNEVGLQDLLQFLPMSLRHRETSCVRLKHLNEARIIGKYFANGRNLETLKASLSKEELLRQFHDDQRLDGIQFCPRQSLERFVNLFRPSYHDERTIWLYLLLNAQPLLMPFLLGRDFPVPRTHAVCGFTIFQEHAGKPLMSFYSSDFRLKLRIARQLLAAALHFSDGVEGFRIYITDLTADNIVYDEVENRLSFVDLDTVYVVDSRGVSGGCQSSVHKHEYIECLGCFAYAPQDICAKPQSDVNLFSTCQLLREDLHRDTTKGFLHPVPESYGELLAQLDECVDCPDATCSNRFSIARELIATIDGILLKSSEFD